MSRKYYGLLKDAKCEQDMFLTMAKIAGDLGVDCGYCHQAIAGSPKDFDFPAMTDRKQVALFMGHEFMDGMKQKNGEEMRCKSCHVDKTGKPAAKFLGNPRDLAFTMEFMNLTMSNRFVHTDGSKVKCIDCHVGNVGTPTFQKTVIMKGEQIHLPGVIAFEKFGANGVPPGVAPPPVAPPAVPSAAPSMSAPPAKPGFPQAKPGTSASPMQVNPAPPVFPTH